jgi:AhpD family alkylhydroperoxidase
MTYREEMQRIKRQTAQLSKALPDFMKAFYGLSHQSSAPGALDEKTKELIALAIGVSQHCDGCIAFHTQSALKAGATHEEILETLSVTVFMGGGPALMSATHAMEALTELEA